MNTLRQLIYFFLEINLANLISSMSLEVFDETEPDLDFISETDANLFVDYFNFQKSQPLDSVESLYIDKVALGWDYTNLFFAATAALESCFFPSITPVPSYKYVLCGIGATGVVFNSAAIFVKLFDNMYDTNNTEIKFFMSTLGFDVYNYSPTQLQGSIRKKKFPELFEQIDRFRETETFAKFSDLGFKIKIDSTKKAFEEKHYKDYKISLDTPKGIGALHGLNIEFNFNQFMLRMMADSRYVNMPSKIIKSIYFLAKQNRKMIKDGEITNFILSIIHFAGNESNFYTQRIKQMFTEIFLQDISAECNRKSYGFEIKDPKHGNVSVLKLKSFVRC